MLNSLGSFIFSNPKSYNGTLFPSQTPMQVYFFYDDDADAIVAQDENFNTVDTSTWPDTIYTYDSMGKYMAIEKKIYSFCSGKTKCTYLADLQNTVDSGYVTRPYFKKLLQPNHFECLQVFCDIHFVGEPTVGPSSAPGVNDGWIQVTASGFNPAIQYAIQSQLILDTKFDSDPPVYQNSNRFDNLFPGIYTIFAKDSNGCKKATNVIVPSIKPQYTNIRIWFYHLDVEGQKYRCNIYEREDSGLTEEVKAGVFAFRMIGANDDDIFVRVKPSKGIITLINEEDFKFLNLFDKEDKYFKLEYIKDPDGSPQVVWTGFMVNDEFVEPNKSPKTYSQITFNDGLGELKTADYKTDAGQDIEGRIPRFQALLNCLRKTKVDFDVRISVQLEAAIVSYNPSTQTILHVDYEDQEVYKDRTCFEVLENLMAHYNARISVKDGKFFINRIDDNVRPYYYVDYKLDGSWIGAGTVNNYKIIRRKESVDSDDFYANEFPLIRRQSGYGKVTIKKPSHLRESVLINSDFEGNEIKDKDGLNEGYIKGWIPYNNSVTKTTTEIEVVKVLSSQDDWKNITQDYLQSLGVPASIASGLTGGRSGRGVRRPIYKEADTKALKIKGNSKDSRVSSVVLDIGVVPGDTYNFEFSYYLGSRQEIIPVVKLKWRLSIGSRTLHKGGTWNRIETGTDFTNVINVKNFNTWQSFNVDVEAFNEGEMGPSENLSLQIWAMDPYPTEFSDDWNKDSPVDGYLEGDHAIVQTTQLNTGTTDDYLIQFWRTDGTNWTQVGECWTHNLTVFDIYDSLKIDNVRFSINPEGEEASEDDDIVLYNDGVYYPEYEESLLNGTLPGPIVNAGDNLDKRNRNKWMFDYYGKTVNGGPLTAFRRVGGTVYQKLETITAYEILKTYERNFRIMDCEIYSRDVINYTTAIVDGVSPIDDLGGGVYQGIIYLISGMEWIPEDCIYKLTMVEMGIAQFELDVDPSESNVDGENSKVVPPSLPGTMGLTGAFNSGFSPGFLINSDNN